LAKAFEAYRQATSEEIDVDGSTELEVLRMIDRADSAISQLELHKKAVTSEYNERVKRLKRVKSDLKNRRDMGTDAGGLALEGADGIQLTEEDERLIYDPVAGL
jgi:hypothetical protein